MNRLFEVVLEIERTASTPTFYAQVSAYTLVAALSEDEAVHRVREDFLRGGYRPLARAPRVTPVPLAAWSDYVAENWPRRVPPLPTSEDIATRLDTDLLIPLALFPHE